MVRIPYIKIPSVRVRCIGPASNIGTGGATPAPPAPITYLTQWKIVGNSEVHTLPYPDGVVLPTGYKRCKYLTFDGSSYIDTGIIPEQGIEVSIKFKFLEQIDDDGIFGCRASAWSADSFYCFRQRIKGMLFVSYGGKICDSGSTDNFVINANDEIELHLDSSFLSFTNGTNTLTTSISSQITKGTKTLYIGAINGYGRKSRIILRTFVLTNGAGNTIFNGIPCLDDNNVPCLYDTVSGTSFYNDGTGTFGYEIEPQPTEIWSCGEYNPIDGKWHILVQPQGGSIADIALTEPLRMVNDIADAIEFPSDTEGKALVTRPLGSKTLKANDFSVANSKRFLTHYLGDNKQEESSIVTNTLVAGLTTYSYNYIYSHYTEEGIYGICKNATNLLCVTDPSFIVDEKMTQAFRDFIEGKEVIYELATPTTELVDAPQIQEADSYSMIISQGGKAVSWSSFDTDSE